MVPLGRLIVLVNQKKDHLLSNYLSPLDITASQFRVLCAIQCEEPVSPRELSRILSVDLGALTRMLNRLADKGWLARLPNPTDKRGVLLRLTPQGNAMCEKCRSLVGQDLHQELTKNLTAQEVTTLEYLMKKVIAEETR